MLYYVKEFSYNFVYLFKVQGKAIEVINIRKFVKIEKENMIMIRK